MRRTQFRNRVIYLIRKTIEFTFSAAIKFFDVRAPSVRWFEVGRRKAKQSNL